ncbi:hypothetical protein TNCT_396421 [Trichonephila clavata]|uniref:Uncharacterized protein n=1 Tax=Trichonephila clavata TaxID=2740835 RepID=A0A8X6KNB9_TRICU|nr:hypothetical protein TNCT_396421 [Trichonephila clavata]
MTSQQCHQRQRLCHYRACAKQSDHRHDGRFVTLITHTDSMIHWYGMRFYRMPDHRWSFEPLRWPKGTLVTVTISFVNDHPNLFQQVNTCVYSATISSAVNIAIDIMP